MCECVYVCECVCECVCVRIFIKRYMRRSNETRKLLCISFIQPYTPESFEKYEREIVPIILSRLADVKVVDIRGDDEGHLELEDMVAEKAKSLDAHFAGISFLDLPGDITSYEGLEVNVMAVLAQNYTCLLLLSFHSLLYFVALRWTSSSLNRRATGALVCLISWIASRL